MRRREKDGKIPLEQKEKETREIRTPARNLLAQGCRKGEKGAGMTFSSWKQRAKRRNCPRSRYYEKEVINRWGQKLLRQLEEEETVEDPEEEDRSHQYLAADKRKDKRE